MAGPGLSYPPEQCLEGSEQAKACGKEKNNAKDEQKVFF